MSAALHWLTTDGSPGKVVAVLILCALVIVPFGLWQGRVDRRARRRSELNAKTLAWFARQEQERRVREVQWARARGEAWLEQVDFAKWDAEFHQ